MWFPDCLKSNKFSAKCWNRCCPACFPSMAAFAAGSPGKDIIYNLIRFSLRLLHCFYDLTHVWLGLDWKRAFFLRTFTFWLVRFNFLVPGLFFTLLPLTEPRLKEPAWESVEITWKMAQIRRWGTGGRLCRGEGRFVVWRVGRDGQRDRMLSKKSRWRYRRIWRDYNWTGLNSWM